MNVKIENLASEIMKGEVLGRDKIKKDLLEQLEEKGLTQSFYTSLVDDYLDLWDIKNMLIKTMQCLN